MFLIICSEIASNLSMGRGEQWYLLDGNWFGLIIFTKLEEFQGMLDNDSDTPEIEQNSETLSEFQDSLEYIYTVKTQCI